MPRRFLHPADVYTDRERIKKGVGGRGISFIINPELRVIERILTRR